MSNETIDTHEAITLFQQVIQPNSPIRILRFIGDGKMGKSHLLTKVFPVLLRQAHQVPSALIDLSRPLLTIPDILSQICIQLDEERFEGFYKAIQELSNRSRVDVKGSTAIFSRVDISTKDNAESSHNRTNILTFEFTKDIRQLNMPLAVLLFDSFDQASEEIRTWLMELLLIRLSRLSHLRIIIAGRVLPEAHGSYRPFCQDFHLQPVRDIKAYFEYCQKTYPTLTERDVSVLAHAFDYNPGFVAETLRKFAL